MKISVSIPDSLWTAILEQWKDGPNLKVSEIVQKALITYFNLEYSKCPTCKLPTWHVKVES